MTIERVAILLDPTNNWLEPYVRPLPNQFLNDERFAFDLHSDPRDVCGYNVVFVLGCTSILPASFLVSNELVLVVHESDLPCGKGFSPVQWQILEGKNEIPVCLFEAVEKVDSGDVFERDMIYLDGTELLDEIRAKQAVVTTALIQRFLEKYPQNPRSPQSGKESFYRRRTIQDDQLHPDRTIKEQFNLLRIANNDQYPLHVTLNNKRYVLKIYRNEE